MGVLLLMGIVKKSSIILVDYANEVGNHERWTAAKAVPKTGCARSSWPRSRR